MSHSTADRWAGGGKGIVLWDETDNGVVVEPEQRFLSTVAAVETLKAATTLGQLQDSPLPDWARAVVDGYVECLEDDDEEATPETPWRFHENTESVGESLPIPHDAASVAAWLGRDFLTRHAHIEGASPGGHVDGYIPHDPAAFLRAIEDRGYTLEQHPGLMQEFWQLL